MKRFRGKETNSICTVASACSNYSSFEAESSKTVLLAHPESRRRREKRDLKEGKRAVVCCERHMDKGKESQAERG